MPVVVSQRFQRRLRSQPGKADQPAEKQLAQSPSKIHQHRSFDANIARDEGDSSTHNESSDEELPSMLTPSKEQRTSISAGDVVWFKYQRFPFWPCVVKSIINRKGRISKLRLMFIEGEKMLKPVFITAKYDAKKIVTTLHEDCTTTKMLAAGEAHPKYSAPFKAACDRFKQYQIDLVVKPDTTPAGVEYFLEKQTDLVDEVEDESAYSAFCADLKQASAEQDAATPSSDTDSAASSAQSIPELSPSKRLKKVFERRKAKGQTLLNFINSNEMVNHLRRVLPTLNKKKLVKTKIIPFGPLDDDDQCAELLAVLEKHYKDICGDCSLDDLDRIFFIWVPEALIYAMMRKWRLSRRKAEVNFEKGIERGEEEHQFSHQRLIRSICPESMAEYRAKLQAALH
ncbi:hypothetical protein CAPTEDRAFT_216012 [Capitella teleta]|uniref:PWWP domain-containing protein n=1 Tax=Capitella teleta TaxID=283909 RepID=R7TSA3_CAPTE|nr:hypothetical protein CAPTEDRAFT_216012 [Capitella teleta]|eukprot:ELT96482.1 hypothetical protein CAPTEDRAFT_216012 [Capitella teleta]